MFTYSFLNNTGAAISIKGKGGVNIVVPAGASYVIKVGESCPIQYKVELHRAKKVFTLASEFILTLRRIHTMLSTVMYDWEVAVPNEEIENKVVEPSKSEEVSEEVPKVVKEASVVEDKVEESTPVSEELATFKVLEFNPVMYVGKPEKILVKVDGDGRALNFKTSDKTVATVTRFGNVQPQAPGICEITVTYNGISRVLRLEVLPAEPEDDPEEE